MKILLVGQRAFGAAMLELLRGRGDDVALVAAPDAVHGRSTDGAPLPDPLRSTAQDLGVPLLPDRGLTAGDVPPGVDLIVAAHSHVFLGRATRWRARLGGIGYHPSLLPLHRGRDAIRWSLAMRERVTGGSVYWLDDRVDAGDLAAQQHVLVRPDDTPQSLWRRELFPLGLRLLGRVLADLDRGRVVRVPQDEELATWEPSWERPRLARPDLPLLPAPGSSRLGVNRDRLALESDSTA